MFVRRQADFFSILKELSKEEQKSIFDTLQQFSSQDLILQQKALNASLQESKFTPLKTCEKALGKYGKKGREALTKNKVGCIVLAAGDGSRLNFQGPKGAFPVIEGKSFFQIFSEKIIRLKNLYACSLTLAIMCSEKNLRDTVKYFEDNHFFCLEKDQVLFFTSKSLPLMDEKGRWFLNHKKEVALGPSGNGEIFSAARKIIQRFKEKNIEHISVIQIENALADPCDEELLGYHLDAKNEVSLKCFQRDLSEEKLGVLAISNGSIFVKEYSDLPKEAFTNEGLSKYPFANVGNYFFSLDFFENMEKKKLPFHLSKKKAIKYRVGNINVLKCERFIFDVLQYSKKTGGLCFLKSDCFAPLKSIHDLVNVQNLLLKKEKVVL